MCPNSPRHCEPTGRRKAPSDDGPMKTISFIISATLAVSPAIAEPLQFTVGNSNVQITDGHPRKVMIRTVAPRREEIKILGRTNTNAQCEMSAETDYQVVEPPQHGTICFRMEKVPLKAGLGQGAKCLGQEAMIWTVYYRPSGPYVGQDSFKYSTIVARKEIAINTADITITNADSPSPKEEPSAVVQATGPMPRCPDALM